MHYGEIKNCDIANGRWRACDAVCLRLHEPLRKLLSAARRGTSAYGKPFTRAKRRTTLHPPAGSLRLYQRAHAARRRAVRAGEPARAAAISPPREACSMPQKTIWSFSGFTLEELHNAGQHMRTAQVTDETAVSARCAGGRPLCGSRRTDISLRFRGSKNQRLIDLNRTRAQGRIVLWDE